MQERATKQRGRNETTNKQNSEPRTEKERTNEQNSERTKQRTTNQATDQRTKHARQQFLTSMPIAGVANIAVTKPMLNKPFLAMLAMLKSVCLKKSVSSFCSAACEICGCFDVLFFRTHRYVATNMLSYYAKLWEDIGRYG
jgi:hypothetical protein